MGGSMTDYYKGILIERSGDHVATITLNRPAAMNAFDWDMCLDFKRAWQEMIEDDTVHAIVLRAAPGRAFCTGRDVRKNDNLSGSEQLWDMRDPGEWLGPKQNRCWKPVIAAVHGLCAGGAFYWINESDIVICSEDAEFFDPHVTFGKVAALEPIGMRWRMPLGDVLRMALLGNDERMCAATALRSGLVSEVVTRDHLWERAHQLAVRIAAKPSIAIQGTVRAIWESLDMGRSIGLQNGVKYCQLGNPLATAQIDSDGIMASAKRYEVR
jgi:enoyl-CoA hydratase/carnithine racemase